MKYYGAVGYSITAETVPGKWEEKTIERNYYGDILKSGKRWEPASDQQNDNLRITDQFSIIADPFALHHFHQIRYITHVGIKWKVTEVSIGGRRLILSVGDVYNGDHGKD